MRDGACVECVGTVCLLMNAFHLEAFMFDFSFLERMGVEGKRLVTWVVSERVHLVSKTQAELIKLVSFPAKLVSSFLII